MTNTDFYLVHKKAKEIEQNVGMINKHQNDK